MDDMRTIIHKTLVHKTNIPICHGLTGPCFNKGKRMRQNTRYVDEERNWVFLCEECAKENHEHWLGMWDEYHSMVH